MADKTIQAAAPAAAPPAPAAAPPATWFIDANTLTCVLQQETNATHGDEVYVASIKFRTRPGVVGTTSTAFTGGLSDISDVNTGETKFLPIAMGRVPFTNVTRLGFAELQAGQVPEVIGTATVLVESDRSADKAVNKLFTEAAAEVKPILAEVSESLSIGDVLDGGPELGAAIADLLTQINDVLKPTLLEKIGAFFGGLGDPDDQIARKLNIFMAVDDVLAPFVDAAIADVLDPDDGVGGGLRTRNYTQRFDGSGAKYELSFNITK